jgi:hypothetical protein
MTPQEISDALEMYDSRRKVGFLTLCLKRTLPICDIFGGIEIVNSAIHIADEFVHNSTIGRSQIDNFHSKVDEYFSTNPEDPGSRVVASSELVITCITETICKTFNILNTLDWAIESVDVNTESHRGKDEEGEWRKIALEVLSKQGDLVEFPGSFSAIMNLDSSWVGRFLADVNRS